MDVEVEKPHVHHHPTGNRWFDLIVPLAALFISAVSIGIAWHHGKVMQELVHQNEKLVEANSLPYLQLSTSNNGAVSFNAINEGVGPAKIVTAEVLVDGRPVQSLKELMDACCKERNRSNLSASYLEGRMVRPGDTVSYVSYPIAGSPLASVEELDRVRRANRITTRLCYCSVFDDCWLASSDDPTPNPVKECAPVARPYRE
jgi:hypothetical protein